MPEARRLIPEGIAAFRDWIAEGAPGDPPHHLLRDPRTSGPLGAAVMVEQRGFDDRYELGSYLTERFDRMDFAGIAFDMGLWDWLTLFWIDAIAPRGASGKRSVREIARYSQDAGSRRWSRHVVRMSWLSVHNHGRHARFFLTTPLDKHTDVIEQIAGQQEFFGSPIAVAVADRLYGDPVSGGVRKRTSSKTAPGVPRRLRKVMKQFRMTFDPESMDVEQMLALLPAEFDHWLKAETRETGRKPAGVMSRIFGRRTFDADGATATR